MKNIKSEVMKRKTFYSVSILLVAGIFAFTSCDNIKENEFDLNALDIELAEDDAIAEDAYNTVEAMVDDEVATLDENNYSSSTSLKSTEDDDDEPFECKVVTVDHPNDTTQFPKIITIDYGEGCTVEINGKQFTRRGMIQIEVNGRRFEDGATRTTTFLGFYINEINIQGTHTITNLGVNDNGNLEFRHELMNGKLVFGDSMQYTRTSNTIRERVRTQTRMTDTIFVSGFGEGIDCDTNAYQYQITERLVLIRCAEYRHQWAIVDGEIETSRDGETTTIDYGNGTCDDGAVLVMDGMKKEFNIRHRYHNRRKVSGN